ncbi:MAG: hypothetical protein JSS00_07840 [Proteobacteria bacterium]|nr:hypothetical protein [Pseudomonadota bacterium]
MAAAKGNKPVRGGAGAAPVAPDARLANALADASWAEADEALAEALAEFAELKRALDDECGERVSEALDMAAQALSRAARRRGLRMFGDVGASSALDARLHDLGGSPSAARVRVVREGVMRGREVLIRALVAPVRKSSKRAPR